jgi:quinol monooxygenase YgiN
LDKEIFQNPSPAHAKGLFDGGKEMKKFLPIILVSTMLLTGGQAMAITVNIYYTGENGNARKFAEEMEQSGTVAAIRAEEGNKKYEYFYPKNDPETVLLIDSWENQEAIDAHHATPMMNKITELRNKYDLHMRVERFIEDETIPEQDQNFIRK